MSKKHNRNRLILARQILAVLAVVLFCVTLFSGYMYFFAARPVPAEPEVTQATAPDTFPTETAATEVPTTETIPEEGSTEASTEAENIAEEASSITSSSSPKGENVPVKTETPTVDPVDPPADPVDPPVDPVDPPADPVDPPADPVDPPADPVDSPADPVDPPADPVDSPADPVDPPAKEENLSTPAESVSPLPPDSQEAFRAPGQHEPALDLWGLIFWSSTALLAGDLIALLLVSQKIRETKQARKPVLSGNISRTVRTGRIPDRHALNIGTLHQPGRREYQQDSLGHSVVLDGKGVLAVVADGMGGLADGDKVSQQIVLRTLELGAKLQSDQASGALYRILNQVNEDINQMLTPEGLYKCGSTMIAVLVQGGSFQWISVGDSRIYLYREGYVNRLNRDHDLLQEWMPEILSGQRSMEASLADPNARKLTSFIGMGRLKYVDGSTRPIDLLPGDRLLLLSDGVYGEVPEERMAAILKQYPDVRQAAAALGQQVQANQNPHQDNYTALILSF